MRRNPAASEEIFPLFIKEDEYVCKLPGSSRREGDKLVPLLTRQRPISDSKRRTRIFLPHATPADLIPNHPIITMSTSIGLPRSDTRDSVDSTIDNSLRTYASPDDLARLMSDAANYEEILAAAKSHSESELSGKDRLLGELSDPVSHEPTMIC